MPFFTRRSPLFPAAYHGDCDVCFAEIEVGDQIGYKDDQLVCLDCYEED